MNWKTSAWERPLTPLGRPFPYRKSRDTSPSRVGRASREGPAETSVQSEDQWEDNEYPNISSHSSTYTVQYIGLAKGELGVLSKKEVRHGICMAAHLLS